MAIVESSPQDSSKADKQYGGRFSRASPQMCRLLLIEVGMTFASSAKKSLIQRLNPGHGRHQHVDVIADDVFEEVSGQTEVGFEMADDRRLCRINIL